MPGLLGLDHVGDDLPLVAVGLVIVVADILALGQQRLFPARQPNAEIGVAVQVVGFVPLNNVANDRA